MLLFPALIASFIALLVTYPPEVTALVTADVAALFAAIALVLLVI